MQQTEQCSQNLTVFAAAFARIPGLDPTTGKFSINSEKSGNGGNAGKAGFGGEAAPRAIFANVVGKTKFLETLK